MAKPTPPGSPSHYYDAAFTAGRVAKGQHRQAVGGMWDEIGKLQLDFLIANGMKSNNRLLDIGCGSLRLGVQAVQYLDSGNYWGTDINESLLKAGYDKEIIPMGLTERLPRAQLVVDPDFHFPRVPRRFDFAMAQSLFTHLPPRYLRRCLESLASHLDGPCQMFATFFLVPAEKADGPVANDRGGETFRDKNPYHYTAADIEAAVAETPWALNIIGEWSHPRGQQIVQFRI